MSSTKFIKPPVFVSQDADEPVALKFDLHLKVREIKHAASLLRKIASRETGDRNVWLAQNGQIVSELLDGFMDDSIMVLDGMEFDGEAMRLSVDLMEELRESVRLFENLMSRARSGPKH